MKKIILIVTAILLSVTYSCQDESETQYQNPLVGLTKTSPLTSLVSRVTQQPTYYDNCFDGSSCFCMVLPVTAIANGHQFTVQSYDDYYNVSEILDEFSTDDNIIHYTFPLTIKYKNYQQVIVNSKAELDVLKSNCGAEATFHEIECIDFVYPISVNTYNTDTQVPSTVSITNNTQWYNYVEGLGVNQIYSLVFPVTMMKSNGQTVIFNTNAELQFGIENAINDCVPTGGTGGAEFSTFITSGSWHVSSFIDGTENHTDDFNGYNFTFSSSRIAIATKNSASINGSWGIHTEAGYKEFELYFEGNTLDKLEEDWHVIEYTATLVRLRHQSNGGGDIHYLDLSKN